MRSLMERRRSRRVAFENCFRWFVGVGIDCRVGSFGVFEEPRSLFGGDFAAKPLPAVSAQPRLKRLPARNCFFC
jgi:hypothetical protein